MLFQIIEANKNKNQSWYIYCRISYLFVPLYNASFYNIYLSTEQYDTKNLNQTEQIRDKRITGSLL